MKGIRFAILVVYIKAIKITWLIMLRKDNSNERQQELQKYRR